MKNKIKAMASQTAMQLGQNEREYFFKRPMSFG
jgi:hypothetical protein